jgi:hypothetical protein
MEKWCRVQHLHHRHIILPSTPHQTEAITRKRCIEMIPHLLSSAQLMIMLRTFT